MRPTTAPALACAFRTVFWAFYSSSRSAASIVPWGMLGVRQAMRQAQRVCRRLAGSELGERLCIAEAAKLLKQQTPPPTESYRVHTVALIFVYVLYSIVSISVELEGRTGGTPLFLSGCPGFPARDDTRRSEGRNRQQRAQPKPVLASTHQPPLRSLSPPRTQRARPQPKQPLVWRLRLAPPSLNHPQHTLHRTPRRPAHRRVTHRLMA